jgi:K+-sensing histidine kinase KdpD
MLALIGYLVEIARLNNRQTKPARGECNILELVAETADRWKKENPSKPLAIQTNIADAVFKLDKGLMRQIFSHLLTFASLRVTEGTVSLSASDSDDTLKIRAQSHGTKSPNKFEMDSTMLHFILTSLVNLHGGQMDDPRETEDGLLLSFSVPR